MSTPSGDAIFLKSESRPDGWTTEAVLGRVRTEILDRLARLGHDPRPEAAKLLTNNLRIAQLLGEAIALAEENTATLGGGRL